MVKVLFYFLIFPGLIFSGVVGGILSWFDRKITAFVQFRKGPPFLQPFYDFVKLLAKETIVPKHGSRVVFLLAPVFALFGTVMASVFILLPMFHPLFGSMGEGFSGDVIVIVYLLNIPSLMYIIGGMAAGNPLSSVGVSREIKLILSYELPFLIALAAIIINADMSIRLFDIINFQKANGAFIGNLSGILVFIVSILCIQTKLGLVPFDVAEAETEITGGVFIEYSGSAYAIIKLTKYIMLFILPAFLVVLFMGGFDFTGINVLWSILKVMGIVLILTLIRNTNPRVKIKQAMRFFWLWMNLFAIAGVVLASFGY